jgi:hypothetical protein
MNGGQGSNQISLTPFSKSDRLYIPTSEERALWK